MSINTDLVLVLATPLWAVGFGLFAYLLFGLLELAVSWFFRE